MPGDNWNSGEANEVVEGVRRLNAQQPLSVSGDTVNVIPHQNFDPYSVFGVGSDQANPYDEPQAFKTNDPNSESVGPYYTNGVDAMMTDVITRSYPIRATPSLIALDGAVSPGERAKPTDAGKATQDEQGDLLCVGDTRDGRAHFVYSPLSQSTVHAHVMAPVAGIAGGATSTCTVISYSDGRDVVSTGPIADRNNLLQVTNWKTELRGETASHQFLVEPWGDGWRIYDEDFICPDDSGGP